MLMSTLGTFLGATYTIMLTGATARAVPITITKSVSKSRPSITYMNFLGKLSPKKTISGLTGPLQDSQYMISPLLMH
jgi:hypothetical protein